MNKKLLCALLALVMVMSCALAMAEITVTKRDMVLNRNLEKSVNNILILMQDGEKTDTMMIASINGKTGRSVMTMIDCATPVNVPEVGDVTLGDVYVLGDAKSRGLLAARTVNSLLDLNISTYVTMDIQMLPELVDQIGGLAMWLNEEEAEILGTWASDNLLSGEKVLEYVRIRLESDYAEKNRCYMVFTDLLKQGLRSTSGTNLMGLGKKLLSSMDTNLNALAAVTMLGSFQGGSDRREIALLSSMTQEEMHAAFYREVYE